MIRYSTKLVAPALYAVVVVLTVFVTYGTVDHVNRTAGFAIPLIVGFVLPYLLIGGVSYGIYGWLLLRLERLERPAVRDHFRRCALLYPFVVLPGPLLVAFYSDDPGAGYAVAAIVFMAAAYATLVDALTLLFQRRFARADSGGSP